MARDFVGKTLVVLVVVFSAPAAWGHTGLPMVGSDKIQKAARTEYAAFVRWLSQAGGFKRQCLLFEERRWCLSRSEAGGEEVAFLTPYRAFSPFNVLGRNGHWPPRERDVRPVCQAPHVKGGQTAGTFFTQTVAPSLPSGWRRSAQTVAVGEAQDFDQLFRDKQLITSKFEAYFNADTGGYRERLLVPVGKVENGADAVRFWEYWANHAPACTSLVCPLVYRDSPVSIAYCRAVAVGGELGPGSDCRRVVVSMPGGPWVEAFTRPHNGGGCGGFGENDFICSVSYDDERGSKGGSAERDAFVRTVKEAMEAPPLELQVTADKGRVVGLGKMRASPVLTGYFEYVSVEVNGVDYGDLGVSVTLLVSRQNAASRSDYRPATDAQQARYVKSVQNLVKRAGCR